jgi:hypothetical protein
MSMRANRFFGALLGAVVVIAVACGGGGGSTNDPEGAVKAALSAASTGGVAKLTDFVCAAQKDDPASLFGTGADSLKAAGIDPTEMFNAMSITVANLATTTKTKTDTAATVHVTGDSTVTVDTAKFKEIMKKVLAAQNKPTDDATLTLVMNAMSSQLSKTSKLDEDVDLVNEGGKWLLCDK